MKKQSHHPNQSNLFEGLEQGSLKEKSPPPKEEGGASPLAAKPVAVPSSETTTTPKYRSIGSQKRAERDMSAREASKRYYERKKIALGLEKKNYDKLVFVYGNGAHPWWKAFNHSAIIFENVIAPQINVRVTAQSDKDFDRKVQAEKVVAYQDIEALKRKLRGIDCQIEDVQDEGIQIFKLKKAISVEEYNLYAQRDQEIVERAGKLLMAHLVDSVLYARLKTLYGLALNSTRRMSGASRELVGKDIELEARMLILKYRRTAKHGTDPLELYEEMLDITGDLDGNLAAILGTSTEDDAKILEMADKTADVKEEILHQIKLIKVKQINKEHGAEAK
ncbi:MAG: hypothetical protein Q4A25_02885 [Candidatus Saccharibacteria bacterium]|nr:hypothetical protein [Candidatus Saccharibacteria bacterium]